MTQRLDERTLQRCVDGELSEADQQALLRQLDHSPTGWRELALAFLEHQLWSQAGRAYVHEPDSPQAAKTPEPAPRPDHSWIRNTVLAASTLLAVGLGYLGGSQRFWPGGSSSASPRTIAQQPASVPQTELASVTKRVPIQAAAPPARRTLTPVMQVQVMMPEGQNAQPITLPVYDAEDLEKYGPWTPPQLSAEVLQRLKDQGVQVQQEPRYYSVPNDQNRKWVVPVNTLQFHQPVQ